MKTYHYVYRIDCLLDGCYYIGVHSTNNINDGYFGSGSGLRASIRKHGKEAFTKTILSYHDTRGEAIQEEVRLLRSGVTDDPLSYNIAYDGIKINHSKKKSIVGVFADYYRVKVKSEDVEEEVPWWKTIRYTFEFDKLKLEKRLEILRTTCPSNSFEDQFERSMLTVEMFDKLADSITRLHRQDEWHNYKKARGYIETLKKYMFYDFLIIKELDVNTYNERYSENKSISYA